MGKRYAKALARLSFQIFFGLAARGHWYWPFVLILTHVITERKSEGKKLDPDAFTLLALSPDTFRGDLDMLANSGHVRILQVPEHWQTRIIYLFYELGGRSYFDRNPAPGTKDAISKQRLLRFYEGVLSAVYARLGVDCVISSHLRWVADLDWGIASKSLGVPYVIIYREGLFATSPFMRKFMLGKFELWGEFKASHLVVQNDICKDFCVDIGFVEPAQVSNLGCLRMDGFLRRIKNHQMKTDAPKRIVLFPLTVNKRSNFGMPLFPVFKKTHVELAKLALRRPDLEIMIKPKVVDHAIWCRNIDHAFQDEDIEFDEIPNLRVKPDVDAQDIILDATVICGMNSTTILEAAIAGKPIVIPMFSEMRQTEFQDVIKFADTLEYLDVADDPEHFIQLIERRLENPVVPVETMAGRTRMFAKYVSNPEGGAVQRHVDLFERLITEAKNNCTKT